MRIAILGTKGLPGHHGVEVVVDSLIPHLASLGHRVTVYGFESYTTSNNNYQGASIKTVRGVSNKNLEMFSHMMRACFDTKRHDYDIVHIHSTDPCLLSWIPEARKGIIATSHGQAYLRDKWSVPAKLLSRIAERFFIRIPNIITSVSVLLSEFYQRKYHRQVEYIPNGIVFRDHPDPKFLNKWQLQPRSFLFCSAGRIERTKGISTLINAYEKLKSDLPLIIAGGGKGTDETYFHDLKKNAPSGVRFVGFLTGDELFALYAHAKVFIFPSEYEAMSMALLEGLSFGTPTVYSNIPENTAVAANIGYPFVVDDADSLSNTINSVINNYERAIEKGLKAASHVKKHHNWVSIAAQYSDLYEKL